MCVFDLQCALYARLRVWTGALATLPTFLSEGEKESFDIDTSISQAPAQTKKSAIREMRRKFFFLLQSERHSLLKAEDAKGNRFAFIHDRQAETGWRKGIVEKFQENIMLLALWDGVHSFRDISKFGNWLYHSKLLWLKCMPSLVWCWEKMRRILKEKFLAYFPTGLLRVCQSFDFRWLQPCWILTVISREFLKMWNENGKCNGCS